MGACPYLYIVPHDKDPQAALDRLRADVFASADYRRIGEPSTPEEALELSGATGTRSILDIRRICNDLEYFGAAPLTDEELDEYFGTATPSAEDVEACDALWNSLDRGQARYVITHENGEPSKLVFWGYSFD